MPRMTIQRVVLAISGGVDSAVAAALLKDAGYDVHALFMHVWDDDEDAYCTSAQDLQDARRVCDDLSLPLHTVDFVAAYRARVFEHFLAELDAGRTPNPDVLCNREIKFGACFAHAVRLGADLFATGHYARIGRDRDGAPTLRRAVDRNKDQSYFLHAVSPASLRRTIFPIGELEKNEVRALAVARGLTVHDKRDSTGICFIGERPFAEFLAGYLPARPGPIESVERRRIGTHRGLMYYTLGQRQGLELGGIKGAGEAPWYVAHKDLERNVLVVVQDPMHALLMSRRFVTAAASWIHGSPPARTFDATVRTRYRQPDQPCTVTVLDHGACVVDTDALQRAVTPGQSAVFYSDELCLGGAVIERVESLAGGTAVSAAIPSPGLPATDGSGVATL
jgi:tRNA-specific 2-thiouridylase